MALRKLLKVAALGLSLFILIESTVSVNAEVNDTASSAGEIAFTSGDGEGEVPTDPENPEDPDPVDPRPEEPDDPGPDPIGEEGLYILLTPKLDFGSVRISRNDASYYAKAQYMLVWETSEYIFRPNYLEVIDLRGNYSGWSVRVKATEQFICEMGMELDGAQIVLSDGWVNSAVHGWEEAEVAVGQDIVLDPREEQVIMRAEAGSGAGRWYGLFGESSRLVDKNSDGKTVIDKVDGNEVEMKFNPSITLEVPGATEKMPHSYSTTLVWTISNTP